MKEPCLVARGGQRQGCGCHGKDGHEGARRLRTFRWPEVWPLLGCREADLRRAARQPRLRVSGCPATPMDYLKYDWCSATGQQTQEPYMLMRDALKLAGRPIVFSLCEWGNSQPRTWAAKVADHHRHRGPVARQAAQERRHCRGDTEPRSCRAGRHPGLGRSRRPAGEDLRRPGPMGAQGTGSDER
jgi:hypothetical protein